MCSAEGLIETKLSSTFIPQHYIITGCTLQNSIVLTISPLIEH